MTPESFKSWRIRLYGERGQKAAAIALGCSRTSIANWEAGEIWDTSKLRSENPQRLARPVPRYIALACQALANGLPPMN